MDLNIDVEVHEILKKGYRDSATIKVWTFDGIWKSRSSLTEDCKNVKPVRGPMFFTEAMIYI